MTVLNNPKSIIKIKPLIKWTGGKYEEYSEFSGLIPPFKKYYEPFFGGGGVFFALQPQGISFLNDKSADLINFYRLISNNEFKIQMEEYASAWEQATMLSKEVCIALIGPFQKFLASEISKAELGLQVTNFVTSVDKERFHPLFSKDFTCYPIEFQTALSASISDKFNRIKNIQIKEGKAFNEPELLDHIETGVKSGLYLFLRGLTNKQFTRFHQLHPAKATANWYFIREFCYASMFRFNKKGEFNIPYGGIGYNSKNFRSKVNAIFSNPVAELFANSFFTNLDFEHFLEENVPASGDFVFLDPPYDTEFSEYDQNTFTKDDQTRLRNILQRCEAKCMLVIKETEFIRDLYSSDHFKIVDFDKTYTYNVRGRNDRGTKHLIILNYDPVSTI